MGAPKRGGQIKLTRKLILGYKEFFKRFVYVRALTGCLLRRLSDQYQLSVNPVAVSDQLKHSEMARDNATTREAVYTNLMDACSFTLVAHPVGSHVDIARGEKRQFIENKALFSVPYKSTGQRAEPSLGRGGGGGWRVRLCNIKLPIKGP